MKSLRLTLISCLLTIASLTYAEGGKSLRITTSIDNKEYPLSEVKSIKFRNDVMEIHLTNGEAPVLRMEDVQLMTWSLEDDLQSIDNSQIPYRPITYTNGVLTITGHSHQSVVVCNLFGTQLAIGRINQVWTLDMTHFPRGMYVVNIEGAIYKFLKR